MKHFDWNKVAIAQTDIRTEMINLDRETAEYLLQFNTKNRAVNKTEIKKLRTDLLHGEMLPNPYGIVISDKGVLISGQKRCLIVKETGVPIIVGLATGVTEELFDVIDAVQVRKISDNLQRDGFARSYCLASAGRMVLSRLSFGSFDAARDISVREATQFIADSSDRFKTLARCVPKSLPGMVDSRMIAALFCATIDDKSLENAEEFVAPLFNNRLAKDDARSPMVSKFEELHRKNKNGVHVVDALAIWARAWNAYVARENLKVIKMPMRNGGVYVPYMVGERAACLTSQTALQRQHRLKTHRP